MGLLKKSLKWGAKHRLDNKVTGKLDKKLEKIESITETKTQTPHTTTTTNFFNLFQITLGDDTSKSAVSVSVTSPFDQFTVRSDFPNIVLELLNYASKTTTYSDGSTETDSSADLEENIDAQGKWVTPIVINPAS